MAADASVRLRWLRSFGKYRREAIADMAARAAVVEAYREVAIKQAELEADVELVRHEHLVRLGHAELLGETEIEIARLEAEEIKFDAQTAGLSEAQKQEYIEFLKKVETPYLSGTQTLDSINNLTDKVTAVKPESIAPEAAEQHQKTSDEMEFDITRLNPSDPTKGKNIAIVAGQGRSRRESLSLD